MGGLPALGAGLRRAIPNIRMPMPGMRQLQVGGGRGISLSQLGEAQEMKLPRRGKSKIPAGLT